MYEVGSFGYYEVGVLESRELFCKEWTERKLPESERVTVSLNCELEKKVQVGRTPCTATYMPCRREIGSSVQVDVVEVSSGERPPNSTNGLRLTNLDGKGVTASKTTEHLPLAGRKLWR
jgi:hypothetical protein